MSEPAFPAPPVRVERAGGIAVVTIDNPPVNALSQAVRVELLRAFRSFVDDASLSGIVLIGAGRSFVAGADIREMDMAPLEPSLPDVMRWAAGSSWLWPATGGSQRPARRSGCRR
jgi:3-hydroxyacyl-CoA dehydrogenase